MDKKSEDNKSNAKMHDEMHLHNHYAPTYNINIGYVAKQINGDYYENNYNNEEKEGIKHKAVKKTKKNIKVVNRKAPAFETSEQNPYTFIINQSLADVVIKKLHTYLDGKDPSQAKDVMKPFRAALEAGVIRRITFEEMKIAFPDYCPKSKTSVSMYTQDNSTPYIDEGYHSMVEDFKKLNTQN